MNDCLLFIFALPIIPTIHKIIFESLKNYLNDIKEYIDSKQNNKDFPTIKAEEHDIYRAYGFLWGIKFILNPTELQNISVFNYKYFENFSIFLEKYGNSRNMKKNYNKNFTQELNKKKLDINIVNKWLKKLEEKKLLPMQVSKNIKKIKKKKEIDNKNDNLIINANEVSINNNLKDINSKNDNTNSFKDEKKDEGKYSDNTQLNQILVEESSKIIPDKDLNNISIRDGKNDKNMFIYNASNQEENKSGKNEKETEESSEDNKNIHLDNENPNIILCSGEINNNNILEKEDQKRLEISITQRMAEDIDKIPFNDLSLKNEKNYNKDNSEFLNSIQSLNDEKLKEIIFPLMIKYII